jgi:hypothetical protein
VDGGITVWRSAVIDITKSNADASASVAASAVSRGRSAGEAARARRATQKRTPLALSVATSTLAPNKAGRCCSRTREDGASRTRSADVDEV